MSLCTIKKLNFSLSDSLVLTVICFHSQLESHPEIYAGYVPMDYREYLKKMPKSVPAHIFVKLLPTVCLNCIGIL